MRPLLLIELLEKFSKKELESLEYFINCPYFNTDVYVIRLFNQLKTNIIQNENDFDETQKTFVYRAVFFPNEKKSKSKLSKHSKPINKKEKANLFAKISTLTRLAERFLMIEQLNKDQAKQQDFLQKSLLEKGQKRLVEQTIKKAEKKLANMPNDLAYYQFKKVIDESKTNYTFVFLGQKKSFKNLLNLKQSLNEYYLIKQLELELIVQSAYNISVKKRKEDTSEFDLKHFLEIPHYKLIPLVQIYDNALQVTKFNKEKDHQTFLELLDKQSIEIDKDLLKNFYLTALNFCSKQIKQGKIKYYQKQYEIYKTLDKKELILIDNQININELKNLIAASCRVNEFNWAKKMLAKYHRYLRKDIQADVRDYNLGIINFYQKKYQAAIDYLFPLNIINLAYDINRRVVIMRSFYETVKDYEEHTHQLFRSFESYIRENKHLNNTDKKGHLNFTRLFINLYRIKHKVSRMSLRRLKEKLEVQQFNIDKSWLLAKIRELENKKK